MQIYNKYMHKPESLKNVVMFYRKREGFRFKGLV